MSHHIAELVNIAPNPQQPFVGRLGLRPQGRPAHQRHRPARRRLRAHRARAGRQRHPFRGLRDGRPLDPGHEGGRARARARRRRPWPRCSTRSSASSTRATTSRWPTARSSCCCAAPPAGSRLLRARVLPGHHRPHRERPRTRSVRPRPRSRCTSATSGSWPPPRATARSTPSTPPCAQAIGPQLPGARRAST